MDKPKVAYYFFEYTHPRTGRARKTAWRMTIEEAKKRHGDAYRPLLDTVEWREVWDGTYSTYKVYPPGFVPEHMKSSSQPKTYPKDSQSDE